MNLKQAFRFSKWISEMVSYAQRSLMDANHALKITKVHLRSEVNDSATDKIEEVDRGVFFKNDDVLQFMVYLMNEKQALCEAITKAKAECGIHIDALIESNKIRQNIKASSDCMMRNVASKKIERGSDYKFDIENKQQIYYYTVEVNYEEDYNRASAKALVKNLISDADEISNEIDSVMVNSKVDFDSVFDVNQNFEDAVNTFMSIA